MKAEMYALHAANEESHWWFAARRSIVLRLLRTEIGEQRRPLRLLDVGCGAGGMLEYLREFGEATGVDSARDAIRYAAEKGVDVRAGSLPDGLPFGPEQRFDVVTLLDVIEHIDDDHASLRTIHGLLDPGGLLLLTVPAFPSLWSGHDVVNEHKRRYTRSDLRALLERAGFEVHTLSYFNTALFLPIAGARIVQRWLGGTTTGADEGSVPRPVNAILRSIFAAERHVLGRLTLPFGVSLIASARASAAEGVGR
jgi:2-polyprenyl-3-methyl-5-hydroxy-6-metoxy-1,4-benzoquinol methylase